MEVGEEGEGVTASTDNLGFLARTSLDPCLLRLEEEEEEEGGRSCLSSTLIFVFDLLLDVFVFVFVYCLSSLLFDLVEELGEGLDLPEDVLSLVLDLPGGGGGGLELVLVGLVVEVRPTCGGALVGSLPKLLMLTVACPLASC